MKREDWEPDYDDEPRSNGNFGLDPQQQEAAEAAKQQKEKAIETVEEVIQQYSNTLKKLAE
jgi:hypothetical protein